MSQNDKLVDSHGKAIEFAQALTHLAIENLKAISEINYHAAKDAVTKAQTKASDLVNIKDVKEVWEAIKIEDAQAVVAELITTQSKVSEILRKSNQEVMEMIESAMNESKADMRKLVKDSCKNPPKGFETFITAFENLFDTSLQSFDQAYSTSKEAYKNLENTIDNTITKSISKSTTTSIKAGS
jgi:uncharacterized membrane protein YccC